MTLKLKHLSDWNKKRAIAAGWYGARLKGIKGIVAPGLGKDRTHVYHLYVVQVPERDKLIELAGKQGIGCGIHYAVPLHLQPAYKALGYKQGDFPVSEVVTSRCVSLPMFPDLTEAQVDKVAKFVQDYAKAGS